jgi:hypothetical protein
MVLALRNGHLPGGPRCAAAVAIAVALLASSAVPAEARWRTAHCDPTSSGFVDVDTAPAANPVKAASLGGSAARACVIRGG